MSHPEEEKAMDTREKWERLTNPNTVEDYGLAISLNDLQRDAPDLYARDVAPLLPPIDPVMTIQEYGVAYPFTDDHTEHSSEPPSKRPLSEAVRKLHPLMQLDEQIGRDMTKGDDDGQAS